MFETVTESFDFIFLKCCQPGLILMLAGVDRRGQEGRGSDRIDILV